MPTAQRLTPALGALIEGCDLSKPLSAATQDFLRNALVEHEVIFFREQRLTPAGHVALARLFGEPDAVRHPKFSVVEGHPEIAIVINDATRPPDIDVWHTDLTFLAEPPAGCVLYCIECPPVGGDTLWASLTSAYAALSPTTRAALAELRARHALRLDGIPLSEIRKLGDRSIEASHPVVRRHPTSGRLSLFVNSVYTRSIEEMTDIESRQLLAMLHEHSQRPEHQVRFKWAPGSIAIWDNRCTQHYAVADYFPARRVMHRVSIVGERPA